ncbi:hypothetical protein ACFOHM_04630 [Microbaculum marinum]|uniref:Response regulatory domain-containing protein n=1 Tax=Microbaculum marinum TaxID=1764581 RepID=A0AAW9RM31_9HYPH
MKELHFLLREVPETLEIPERAFAAGNSNRNVSSGQIASYQVCLFSMTTVQIGVHDRKQTIPLAMAEMPPRFGAAGERCVSGQASRAALFLMDNEALALELQGKLRSSGPGWTVMLTRAVDAARAALFAGRVDLAVLVPGPGAKVAIDELIAALHAARTPTILVSDHDEGQADIPAHFVRLSYPVDADRLTSALLSFLTVPAPVSPSHAS